VQTGSWGVQVFGHATARPGGGGSVHEITQTKDTPKEKPPTTFDFGTVSIEVVRAR